jgi:hypothetical protein
MKRTIITIILTLAFTAFAIQAVEQKAFSGAGVIESTAGGFMFPDGSVQASASAPPTCTPITTLPSVITVEGVYCFTGNLTTSMASGNAIEIQSDNVTIEMNGWKLEGQFNNDTTTAYGIYASSRVAVTVRNGTVKGFLVGIQFTGTEFVSYADSRYNLVEHVLATDNTATAISMKGQNNTIRYNRISGTGGSTVVNEAMGIELTGSYGQVIGNDINATQASGGDAPDGIGIACYNSQVALIKGNRIFSTRGTLSDSTSIYLSGCYDSLVVGNELLGADRGIWISDGSSKYRDNLTALITTPYTGGIDAGNND